MARTVLRAALLTLAACTALAGCSSSYYRVSDPGSGREYYTTEVEKMRDGAVTFKDAKTKSEVTLQSSEVTEIEKSAYEAAVKSK